MAKYRIQKFVGVTRFFFFFLERRCGRPVGAAAGSLPSPSAFALCSQCSSCKALPSPRSRRHVRRALHVPRDLAIPSVQPRPPPPPRLTNLDRCSLPPILLYRVPEGQKAAADNLLGIELSVRFGGGGPRQLKQRRKRRGARQMGAGEQIEDLLEGSLRKKRV